MTKALQDALDWLVDDGRSKERQAIIDYVKRLDYKWSSATIRPNRETAIALLVDGIERGEHLDSK